MDGYINGLTVKALNVDLNKIKDLFKVKFYTIRSSN